MTNTVFSDSKTGLFYRCVYPLLTRKDLLHKYASLLVKTKAVVYFFLSTSNKKRLMYEYLCILVITNGTIAKI